MGVNQNLGSRPRSASLRNGGIPTPYQPASKNEMMSHPISRPGFTDR